jgi:3-deoxy-alpha-D-manno-octulosonate 8-oxidase
MRNLEASEKIECLRYLEYGKKIKLAISTTKNAVEIDTPEDLIRANKLMNKNNY